MIEIGNLVAENRELQVQLGENSKNFDRKLDEQTLRSNRKLINEETKARDAQRRMEELLVLYEEMLNSKREASSNNEIALEAERENLREELNELKIENKQLVRIMNWLM